jgi:hypothetical protein
MVEELWTVQWPSLLTYTLVLLHVLCLSMGCYRRICVCWLCG